MIDHMIFTRPTADLLPPSIRDARSIAFMAVMQQALLEPDFKQALVERIDSVDARLLPALIRELSCEEFIEPGMSEGVVRRLLKRAYALHASKGYLYGIRLGLSLLGMRVHWTQWYNHTPKRPAGTHKAVVYANEYIFDNQGQILDLRTERAARRMIDGMKRWSQDVDFSIGIGVATTLSLAMPATLTSAMGVRASVKPRMVSGAIGLSLNAHNTALLPLKLRISPRKETIRLKSRLSLKTHVQSTLLLPLTLKVVPHV
jgi:phage tail P2-like protein